MIKLYLLRWKEILLITFSTRLILFIISAINSGENNQLLSSWIRWDGPHYIDIAQNGYKAGGEQALWIVFYPLYPLLIKAASLIISNFSLSAVFVSIIFSFVASVALFELTLLDFEKRVAILGVWFMNIFPTAYFLQGPYTESLFIALSILTVYFFRRNLFLTSGIFGFLASLTRANGVLLLPILLVEKRPLIKALPTLLLILLGFTVYLGINLVIFKNPFYFTQPLSSNWYKKIDWPWVGINNLIHSIPTINNPNFYIYFSELVFIVFILFLGIYTLLKARKSYGIYLLLNLLLIISTKFILSTPRYSLILFPIFIVLGKIRSNKIITGVSVLFTTLLYHFCSLYIQGQWAF